MTSVCRQLKISGKKATKYRNSANGKRKGNPTRKMRPMVSLQRVEGGSTFEPVITREGFLFSNFSTSPSTVIGFPVEQSQKVRFDRNGVFDPFSALSYALSWLSASTSIGLLSYRDLPLIFLAQR